MAANSFIDFKELVLSGKKEPSRSNLFSVQISVPPCIFFNDKKFAFKNGSLKRSYKDHWESINYFANSVTVPGRRITTSTVRDIGAPRKFATDTAFGDVQVEFLVTKDMYHRQFFENWMNYTATDAENRASFYDEYTADFIVSKWELGSNILYKHKKKHKKPTGLTRLNRTSAVWYMYGAFPYDMSEMTFNNGPTELLKLNVSFHFERYRFDTIDGDGIGWGPNVKDKIIDNTSDVLSTLGYSIQQQDVFRVGV